MIINSDKKLKRENYASASRWEDVVGYSRAVKVGNLIEVAGTTAIDEHGTVQSPGDPYLQACYIFRKIERILQQAGARLDHVVRTRMFLTDIGHWEAVGKAHSEFFDTVRPVASMLEVQKLISPELLVEIEVTAIINQ